MRSLFDTDIVSEINKNKNPAVAQKAFTYLSRYGTFTLSLITRYEVLRGLIAKGAPRQRAKFETFCQHHQVLPLSDDIIVIAAGLWARLRKVGQPIEDNDILIAATALHHNLPVATRNVAHFIRIPGLAVEDWSIP
jgi:tRNA(fMet)-specific endonuclease VapC